MLLLKCIFGHFAIVPSAPPLPGLHKEPSLKARLELYAINVKVLEMRRRSRECRDAATGGLGLYLSTYSTSR